MAKIFKFRKTIFLGLLLTNLLLLNVGILRAEDVQMLGPDASNALSKQDQAFLDASGLSTKVTIGEMISNIIKIVLSFLGLIFFVLILYAGFLWMTAAGNDEKISKAKNIMTSAVIGLVIVLSAYLITYFVVDQALEATSNTVGLD
jgi:hypothetical protein